MGHSLQMNMWMNSFGRMTDVGIDLKAIDVKTYCRITGIEDRKRPPFISELVEAVRYISQNYKDRLFLGVGIPYNRDLI
jgi:pyruvate formate lyase activating enzyme